MHDEQSLLSDREDVAHAGRLVRHHAHRSTDADQNNRTTHVTRHRNGDAINGHVVRTRRSGVTELTLRSTARPALAPRARIMPALACSRHAPGRPLFRVAVPKPDRQLWRA